jgi:hypothetical protein
MITEIFYKYDAVWCPGKLLVVGFHPEMHAFSFPYISHFFNKTQIQIKAITPELGHGIQLFTTDSANSKRWSF